MDLSRLLVRKLVGGPFKVGQRWSGSKISNPPVNRTSTAEAKCGGIGMKHKLVPCRECDMVEIQCKEPLAFPEDHSFCNPPRVVIIGAGLAGLSAADRLIRSGVKDVTILEAKHRPGGRVHTCKMKDNLVELGAEYIDGASIPNPAYQLASMKKLIEDDQMRYDNQDGVFITSCGRALEADPRVFRSIDKILTRATMMFEKPADCPDIQISVGEVIQEGIPQVLGYYEDWETEDVRRKLIGIANEKRAELGEDLYNVTAYNYGSQTLMPGGRLRFTEGASSLINALLKNIPTNNIHYCKVAQCVLWSMYNKPKACVKCCDGSEFSADYVIVTVPLGVLKSQIDRFFCPPLPPEKAKALCSVTTGHICKIFFSYDQPFWIKGEGTIRFAWTASELSKRHDWFCSIGTIEEVLNSEDTLKVTVGGKEVVQIEKSCESDVAVEFTRWLRKLTGDKLIPYPSLIARSQWTTDLFTEGARCVPTPQHQCVLAAPVPSDCPPIILFAGEATAPGQAGTMHGAMTSGVREADRILSLESDEYYRACEVEKVRRDEERRQIECEEKEALS